MRIALILKPGHENTGIGRYAAELENGLLKAGCEVVRVHPKVPLPLWLIRYIKKVLHWDLVEFFNNYPVWASYPKADIYHFTSQNLATLVKLHPPHGAIIVTVHDIFPTLLQNDPEIKIYQRSIDLMFDKISIRGLKKANHIISVSSFTRELLLQTLGMNLQKISVILEGVKSNI